MRKNGKIVLFQGTTRIHSYRSSRMLKLIKRGKTWYLRGTVAGQSIYESTGTHSQELAEQYRIKEEYRLLTSHIHGYKHTITFAEAANSYLDAGGSKRFLNETIRAIGKRRLMDIDQTTIDKIALETYPKAKPQTRNRHLYTPFIAVWNHACENGWCEFRRWRRPTVSQAKKTRYLTPQEAKRLYESCNPKLKPLYIFLLYTGVRRSEALSLKWEDIDLKKKWAVIWKTKTNISRGVPLHKAVVDELSKLEHRQGGVFLNRDGTPYTSINKIFQTAWKRAKIEKVSIHDLRRTCATWMQLKDVPREVRQDILGHSRKEVHDIYAQVPQNQMIREIRKLNDIR